VIAEAWSKDGGVSWGRMTTTSLPNPSAGIDALRLADGRFLLVYNPSPTSRAKLALAVSGDGKAWRQVTMLEDESQGEFSYPAMIQSRDGQVHITYTWRREKIKHVAIDPATIEK
jgi:predicted neuraminidase